MKTIALILIGMLAIVSVSLATPKVVPGVKCVECHFAGKFNKNGLNENAKFYREKFKGKKCSECHVNKGGKLGLKGNAPK